MDDNNGDYLKRRVSIEAKGVVRASFSSTMSSSLDSLDTLEAGEARGSGNYRPSRWVYFACLAAQMSAFSMGTSFGWSAPATEEMSMDNTKIYSPYHGESSKLNFIASFVTLGAFIGAFFCGVSMDFLGRRRTLLLLGVPYFTGWLIIALSSSFPLLLVGRLLTGFPNGITSGVLPTYVAEISTPKIRGFVGMLFNFFVVGGIVFVDVLNVLGFHWAALAFWCLGPAAILMAAMFVMPESPTWLINSNRDHTPKGQQRALEAAIKSLRRLRHRDSDIRGEAEQLQDNYRRSRQSQKGQLRFSIATLKRADVYKPMLIGMAFLFFQQFCGVNAVQFYSNNIFKDAGSSIDPKVATLISNTFMLIFTIVGSLIIDRFGRRVLLIASAIGLMVSIAVLGGYYFQHRHDLSSSNQILAPNTSTTMIPEGVTQIAQSAEKQTSFLPVVCVAVFVSSFSLGVGPICWIVITEITPPQTIGLVTSTSSAMAWVFTFAVVNNAEYFHQTLTPYGTYWMFAGFSLLSGVFAWFLPETKGKTIDQISKIFGYQQHL